MALHSSSSAKSSVIKMSTLDKVLDTKEWLCPIFVESAKTKRVPVHCLSINSLMATSANTAVVMPTLDDIPEQPIKVLIYRLKPVRVHVLVSMRMNSIWNGSRNHIGWCDMPRHKLIAAQLFSELWQAQCEQIISQANLVLRADEDIEIVHQYRIAIRKARSLLVFMKPLLKVAFF